MSAMVKEERPALVVHMHMAQTAIANLQWLIDGIRDGRFIVEDSSLDGEVVALPSLPDEEWVVSASTGKIAYAIKVRVPETQKKYAAQLLERIP